MKKNLLLLFTVICIPASYAGISSEEASSPEFIINNGYSEAFAEEVNIAKLRANGKPSEPLYNKNQNKFVRLWRNFYGYLDPAVDTEQRIHHDVQMSPSWKDL